MTPEVIRKVVMKRVPCGLPSYFPLEVGGIGQIRLPLINHILFHIKMQMSYFLTSLINLRIMDN